MFDSGAAVLDTAHLIGKRYRLISGRTRLGVAVFATAGAERALTGGAAPIVAVTMGVITACFGGVIRDVPGQERSIIFALRIEEIDA